MAEDHVFIRGEGGGIFKMSLPLQADIEKRLVKGYLKRVNADGSLYVEAAPLRPAVNASKAEWVGWAVHNGMTPDDAEALTKADLVDRFGGGVRTSADEPATPQQTADKFFDAANEPADRT